MRTFTEDYMAKRCNDLTARNFELSDELLDLKLENARLRMERVEFLRQINEFQKYTGVEKESSPCEAY